MATLLSAPYNQFLDDDGNPLTLGTVYSYEAGTDTPKATYTSYTGLIEASNPVELDAAGRADIWITGSYKFTVKDADGVTIRTVDHVTAVDQGGDMTKAVYDPANIAQQLVGTTAVQTVTNKTLTNPSFSAGTVSAAANTMSAGANLTVATAGSTEYDGKVQYFTPEATNRGIIASAQQFEVDSAIVGTNVNTVQAVFAKSVSLLAGTRYDFEATYIFAKTAGASAHTVGISFGGSATYTIVYDVIQDNNTTNLATLSAPTMASANAATTLVLTGSISSANSFVVAKLRGTISCSVAGNLTPQYLLSAAPGGAYSTNPGSFFRIWPVGATGANISVGSWA